MRVSDVRVCNEHAVRAARSRAPKQRHRAKSAASMKTVATPHSVCTQHIGRVLLVRTARIKRLKTRRRTDETGDEQKTAQVAHPSPH